MECSIYTLGEVKKKRRLEARSLLVLARFPGDEESGERLILVRDERNALWMLPGGVRQQGGEGGDGRRGALVAEFLAGGRPVVEVVFLQDGEQFGLGHAEGGVLQFSRDQGEGRGEEQGCKGLLHFKSQISVFGFRASDFGFQSTFNLQR